MAITLAASAANGEMVRFGLSRAMKVSARPELVLATLDGRFLGENGWQGVPVSLLARPLGGRRTCLEVRLPAADAVLPGTPLLFRIPEIEYQEAFTWPAAIPRIEGIAPTRNGNGSTLAPRVAASMSVLLAACVALFIYDRVTSRAQELAQIQAEKLEILNSAAVVAKAREGLGAAQKKLAEERGELSILRTQWLQAKTDEEKRLQNLASTNEQFRKTLEIKQAELNRLSSELSARQRIPDPRGRPMPDGRTYYPPYPPPPENRRVP